MSTVTAKGGLVKPDDVEAADVDVINDNYDKIASLGMGPFECTSTTRPGTPWTGMLIYETDTDRVAVYLASGRWKYFTNTGWTVDHNNNTYDYLFTTSDVDLLTVTGVSVPPYSTLEFDVKFPRLFIKAGSSVAIFMSLTINAVATYVDSQEHGLSGGTVDMARNARFTGSTFNNTGVTATCNMAITGKYTGVAGSRIGVSSLFANDVLLAKHRITLG